MGDKEGIPEETKNEDKDSEGKRVVKKEEEAEVSHRPPPPPEIVKALSESNVPSEMKERIFGFFSQANQVGPLPPDPETARVVTDYLTVDSNNQLEYFKERLKAKENDSQRSFELAKNDQNHLSRIGWFILAIFTVVLGLGFFLVISKQSDGYTILTHGLAAIGGAGGWKLLNRHR